jgi:TetR/AcrR family transcriptional regulator
MSDQDRTTEEIIFDAAQKVFVNKGFFGARMEEIAQEASINKALLHYYFRTKEKLFNAIFSRVFSQMIPKVLVYLESDAPLISKIEFFIDTYIEMLMKNPFLPNFIISEINRNPDSIAELLGNLTGITKNDAFGKFSELIKKETENGTIRAIAPEQLIVNMIALCVFPFVARPIVQGILFKNDKKQYQLFLESRKKEVTDFIIHSIKIEK